MSNEDIVRKIQAGVDVSHNLELLYKNNLGFIKKTVKPFTAYEDEQDLLQEAFCSLYKSAEKYDFDAGANFLTYAKIWIEQTCRRYIENCGSLIRLPSHIREQIFNYKKTVRTLEQEQGRTPTVEQVAAAMQQPVETIQKLELYACGVCSLDSPIEGADGSCVGDMIQSDVCIEDNVIDDIAQAEMQSEVWAIINEYTTELECAYLRECVAKKKTLQWFADNYGLTINEARRTRQHAFAKLNKSKAKKALQNQLDYGDASLYRNGLGKYKNNNFTSTVERVAINRVELEQKYKDKI